MSSGSSFVRRRPQDDPVRLQRSRFDPRYYTENPFLTGRLANEMAEAMQNRRLAKQRRAGRSAQFSRVSEHPIAVDEEGRAQSSGEFECRNFEAERPVFDIDRFQMPLAPCALRRFGTSWTLANVPVPSHIDAPPGMALCREPFLLIASLKGFEGPPASDPLHASGLLQFGNILRKGLQKAGGTNNPKLKCRLANGVKDWKCLTRSRCQPVDWRKLEIALQDADLPPHILHLYLFGQKWTAEAMYPIICMALTEMEFSGCAESYQLALNETQIDFGCELWTTSGVVLAKHTGEEQWSTHWHGRPSWQSAYPILGKAGANFGGHSVRLRNMEDGDLRRFTIYSPLKHNLLAYGAIPRIAPYDATERWFYDRRSQLDEISDGLSEDIANDGSGIGGMRGELCTTRILHRTWEKMAAWLQKEFQTHFQKFTFKVVQPELVVRNFQTALRQAKADGLFRVCATRAEGRGHAVAAPWKRWRYYRLLHLAGFAEAPWSKASYINEVENRDGRPQEFTVLVGRWRIFSGKRKREASHLAPASQDPPNATPTPEPEEPGPVPKPPTKYQAIQLPEWAPETTTLMMDGLPVNDVPVPPFSMWERLAKEIGGSSAPAQTLHQLAANVDWRIAAGKKAKGESRRGWTARRADPGAPAKSRNVGLLGYNLIEATFNLSAKLAASDLSVEMKSTP